MTETSHPPARLTASEVSGLIDESFPHVHAVGGRLAIDRIGPRTAVVRLTPDAHSVRPGGTISGPAMFTLADFAAYVAILGELGAGALQAVTSTMTINFLSRPVPADLIAHVRLIKIGRRLAVANIELFADGQPAMVAHATATYAIPILLC